MSDDISAVLTNDPVAVGCPYGHYAAVREEGGIVHDPVTDVYVVTRHDLIQQVNTNPRVFSNQNPMGPMVLEAIAAIGKVVENSEPELARKAEAVFSHGAMLFTADPPDHTRHRKLLSKAMTPKSVSRLEPEIQQICDELIDGFIADGTVDIVGEYAVTAPVRALALLLGVPEERSRDFSRWAEAINSAIGRALTPEDIRNSIEGQMEFWEFFEAEFSGRMGDPDAHEDLLTALVQARIDGERPLDLEEMVSFASNLIGAGADTTSKLLASALYMLCTDDSLMAKVRADRELIPRFLEESLRMESPVQGLFRVTMEDTTLAGVDIPAGKFVWVVYAGGNRDDAVFDCPDQFRLDRGRSPHLAFGHGPHACVGSAFARMVARIAFDTLLDRLDDIRLADPGAPADYDLGSYVLHGIRRLDLTFTAAERVSAPA